ncbi:ThuA domain-containing protein [Herbidospora daliensis]|uniref:ThuA domain-containing protein n=1 Tax=Herbidospora daliensis TaxID=295585 RepID=UPI000AD1AAF0|nr:ThuA domain-containing protein [Herbidospora daliensis]
MSPRLRRWATLLSAAALTITGTVVVSAPAQAVDIPAADYQQVPLAVGSAKLGEAMSLAVLPNRNVVHTARDGWVRVTTPAGITKNAGKLNVYTHDEEGLQGVAADPAFATNRWIYLFYSPRLDTPTGDAPKEGTPEQFEAWKGHLNLSRFTLNADDTLDLASEKVILEVPNDRGQCCHVGGDIDFDAEGNLYLTTGDDTNPFESDAYTPIDERTTRNPQFDAQRSSGNTNDLRGKVLRITPKADGTYTIPEGNMFAPGTAGTRPEIYAMGFRNPFRMSVDKATGIVYLGDYGPDAGGPSASRGPAGQVEFNRVTGPGNYGWPYCTGTNTSNEVYNEYTFPSGPSGAKYDCANGPANNSFRNTGLATLPPAVPAWIKYGFEGSPTEFGGGSESPMGGPVYRYDAGLESNVKFPQSLDGRFFAGELGRKWIKAIEVKADGSRGEIAPFPWTGQQVMDMAFGPDGALYVLDYGSGAGDQAIYRIDYLANSNRSPVARIVTDRISGVDPLTVKFTGDTSSDPEGSALTYAWDFGDGGTSTEANPTHTFEDEGVFDVVLTVTDPDGATGSTNVSIHSGNTLPTVTLKSPVAGALFDFGDTIPFEIEVTDPEDGDVDCGRVELDYALGHDQHAHLITSRTGCTGTIVVPKDGEHDAAANLYGVFTARYVDEGGLENTQTVTLQPKHRQAEHAHTLQGVQVTTPGGSEGGRAIGHTDNNDWISFEPYALGNATKITVRTASGGVGGTIEVRAGSPTGTLLGTVAAPKTAGWGDFVVNTGDLTNAPAGTTKLYLVFKGPAGALFDLDWFDFTTTGELDATTVEGEAFTSTFGVQDAPHGNASGGKAAGYTDPGDWAGYAPINLTGATTFTARIASGGPGGTLSIRHGSQTGPLLGTITVANTGGWEDYVDLSTRLTNVPAGNGQLFLVFDGPSGRGALFDVDYWTLVREPIPDDKVLVFSKTAGFRHGSIGVGLQALTQLGQANGFEVVNSEDGGDFTAETLSQFKAVVFLSTTGDVLTDPQQAAFEDYVDGGGGYMGVHAAADTEYGWSYYGGLVGAYFKGHPATQPATVVTEDHDHPATAHLADEWTRTDEWYNYRTNPRGSVHVLQTLDESSYQGGDMGADHPITWCKTQGEGRSFYTGLGHTDESYAEPAFRQLLLGGLEYAMGREEADCSADATGPAVSAATTPAAPDGANGWFVSTVTVTITADDPSGVDTTEYRLDGGAWTAYTTPIGIAADGPHTVEYRATDGSGNTTTGTLQVAKDATAPLTAAQFAPANDDGWHNGGVPVTLSAADPASGVAKTEYSLDGGAWTAYTGPVTVTGEGTHDLTYRSTDKAGNAETVKAAVVRIDGSRPTILISGLADGQIYGDSQDLRMNWQAVDATSGVKTLVGELDGTAIQPNQLRPLYELALRTHTLKVTATDKAGNQSVETVVFGVTTSTRDLANLIDRFTATGRLTQSQAGDLHKELTRARKAEADADDAKTIRALTDFKDEVAATDAEAEIRDVLTRDADAVIARLGGQPTGSACTATYRVTQSWNGGFGGEVTVKNTGGKKLTGWTVTWTWPSGQTVTKLWNGTHTQTGADVTVGNAAYNGALAVNAQTTFGFNGSYPTLNTAPEPTCTAA